MEMEIATMMFSSWKTSLKAKAWIGSTSAMSSTQPCRSLLERWPVLFGKPRHHASSQSVAGVCVPVGAEIQWSQASAREQRKLSLTWFLEHESCCRQDETGWAWLDLFLLGQRGRLYWCVPCIQRRPDSGSLLRICHICPLRKTHNHGVALLSKVKLYSVLQVKVVSKPAVIS